MFILQLIFILMTNSHASPTCVPTSDGLLLNLVNPAKTSFVNPVQTHWQLDQNILRVHFEVNAPVLHKKDVYGPNDYPFQYDVVEVFIAVNDPKEHKITYYEYEITPLNQVYNLRLDVVEGKRISTDLPKIDARAKVEGPRWSATLNIPLDSIGWNGDVSFLRGNFYAIIGKKPRTYWSAFLPPQTKANFHKPEFFQSLFDCQP